MMEVLEAPIARPVAMSLRRRALAAFAIGVVSPLVFGQSAQKIPTVYEAGHFYATPETVDGHKLRLVVDTGGGGVDGMYWVTAKTAKRLALKPRPCKTDRTEKALVIATAFSFKPGSSLPPPLNSSCGAALMIHAAPVPQLFGDGQLGAGYLPGRIWTFDYPGRQLFVQPMSWQPDAATHAAQLGLSAGSRHFARIMIKVAGESIPMLLDTGATAHPTAAGEAATHTPLQDGYGVASYIDATVFDRLHKAHPSWRVVKNGDDLGGPKHAKNLLEIPEVTIAGWAVGPVWLTEQAGIAEFLSKLVGQPIEGAVGGNVFRHFVMTVDYPHKAVYFKCVVGCKAASSRQAGGAKPM